MFQELKDFILSFKEEFIKSADMIAYEELMDAVIAKNALNDKIDAAMEPQDIYFYLMVANIPDHTLEAKRLFDKYKNYFVKSKKRKFLKIIFWYHIDGDFSKILDIARFASNDEARTIAADMLCSYMSKYSINLINLSNLAIRLDHNSLMVKEFSLLNGMEKSDALNAFRYASDVENLRACTSKNPLVRFFAQHNGEEELDELAKNAFILFLQNSYKKYKSRIERAKKAISKNNDKLDNLINLLSFDGEIKKLDEILRLCINPEIKAKVVDYILNHNLECYNVINQKYQSIKNNDVNNFIRLMKSYGYSFNNFSVNDRQVLIAIGYQHLSEILEFLQNNNVHMAQELLAILSYEQFLKIKELYDNGYINQDFIVGHEELFLCNNNGVTRIIQNIEFFKSQRVNMINYVNDASILLSEKVVYNYNILLSYGLEINKNTLSVAFLQDDNLEEKIELLIEMGLLNNIYSLDILNKTFEELYRDKICMLLNISNSIADVYNHEEFFIDLAQEVVSDQYKAMFQGESIVCGRMPDVLQKYQINRQVLLVNGVYVSIKRLCDNLSKVGELNNVSIFYAIIYGSYYTMMEIEALKAVFCPDVLDNRTPSRGT